MRLVRTVWFACDSLVCIGLYTYVLHSVFRVENNSLEIQFALIVIKTDVSIPDVSLHEIPNEDEDEKRDFQEFLHIVLFSHEPKQYFYRLNYFILFLEKKFIEQFHSSKDIVYL